MVLALVSPKFGPKKIFTGEEISILEIELSPLKAVPCTAQFGLDARASHSAARGKLVLVLGGLA
jgi:hypothetical protein